MVMPDHSDFQSQGEIESSVQASAPEHPDNHEHPSLDRQSSFFSLTLDDFQHTFSGDIGSFGSMSMDELLSNMVTEEEIQAFAQTLVSNTSTALCTAAPTEVAIVPTAAATSNNNPQHPEGMISTSSVNDTAIWREVDSSQHQATNGGMTLEDFFIMAGVVPGSDRPPSPVHQQSFVSHQHNNSTGLPSGPAGDMVRPVMASGGGINVPSNPTSSESVGADQSGRLDDPVEKAAARKIRNRESAARTRARRQAYTCDLEEKLRVLNEKNSRLRQDLETMDRRKKQESESYFHDVMQEMEELKKARKDNDGKKGLKRSWSCLY
uniref:BZIP domain-containing protein n=1 Tax=Daucus carota subsp. sativus TaxID=79200 RepID=A0A166ES85_DAUCS